MFLMCLEIPDLSVSKSSAIWFIFAQNVSFSTSPSNSIAPDFVWYITSSSFLLPLFYIEKVYHVAENTNVTMSEV